MALRVSKEEFEKLVAQNPNLRVSRNSASRNDDQDDALDMFARIAATESVPHKKHRVTSIKKRTTKNATKGHSISYHAKRLMYFIRHPDKIKGKQEHYNQVMLFDYFERFHPEVYEVMAAMPNGGLRSDKTARDMLAEGQKKGYPDIIIDMAKGRYHGLRLELKAGKNNCSESQKSYQVTLRNGGFAVVVAWEFEAAKRAIEEYINLPDDGLMSSMEYR